MGPHPQSPVTLAPLASPPSVRERASVGSVVERSSCEAPADGSVASILAAEHRALTTRTKERRARIEQTRSVLDVLERQAAADERQLSELEALLGIAPQLRIDELDKRLRGQRLQEVAVEVLRREVGPGRPLHYREWYELVRAAGYAVAGRDPVANFLAQISRSPAVEGVGQRSGRYLLRDSA